MIPIFTPHQESVTFLPINSETREEIYHSNLFDDFKIFCESKLDSLNQSNPNEIMKLQSLDQFLNCDVDPILESFALREQFIALKLLLTIIQRMEQLFEYTPPFYPFSLKKFPGFTFSLVTENSQELLGIKINDGFINIHEQFFLAQLQTIQHHFCEDNLYIIYHSNSSQITSHEFLTRFGSAVAELYISETNEKILNELLKNYPRLKKLHIQNPCEIENLFLSSLEELIYFSYSDNDSSHKMPIFHWSESILTLDLALPCPSTITSLPSNLRKLSVMGEIISITAPLAHLVSFEGNIVGLLKELPFFSSNLKFLKLHDFYNLTNLNHIPSSIEILSLNGCSHLETIDFFPKNLKNLIIIGCLNLKKLPFFPETLEKLKIDHLKNIEDFPNYPPNLKVLYLGSKLSFDKIPKTGLKNLASFDFNTDYLYNSSYQKNLLEVTCSLASRFTLELAKKILHLFLEAKITGNNYETFINHLIEKLTIEYVLKSFAEIEKVVYSKQFLLFHWKIWNRSPFQYITLNHPVFTSRELLLTKTFTGENSAALEILSKKLNVSKMNQVIHDQLSKKEALIPTDADSIFIENLFPDLFNQINFKNPEEPDYLDPTSLKDGNQFITLDYLKEGLFKLINNIKERKSYLGVPIEEQAKELYYQTVEKKLKQFLALAKNAFLNKEDQNFFLTARRELIHIALAGNYCGSRWLNDPKEAIDVMTGNLIKSRGASSVEALFEKWIEEDLFSKIQILKTEYTKQFGISNEIHIHNQILRLVSQHAGIHFEEGTFQIDDPIILLDDSFLINLIKKFWSPVFIIRLVWNQSVFCLKEETKRINEGQDSGKSSFLLESFVQVMRGVIEEQFINEVAAIENELPLIAFKKGKEILGKRVKELKVHAFNLEKKIDAKKQIKVEEKVEKSFLKNCHDTEKMEDKLKNIKRKRSSSKNESMIKKQKTEGTTFDSLQDKPFFKLKKKEEKLDYLKKKIMKYEKILQNEDLYPQKIREIGMESARSSILVKKELFLDESLEKEWLFLFDAETLESKITTKGIYLALKYLGFLI